MEDGGGDVGEECEWMGCVLGGLWPQDGNVGVVDADERVGWVGQDGGEEGGEEHGGVGRGGERVEAVEDEEVFWSVSVSQCFHLRLFGVDGRLLLWVVDAVVFFGLGKWETISEASALSDLPRPLIKTSASRGFFTVARDTNITLERAICLLAESLSCFALSRSGTDEGGVMDKFDAKTRSTQPLEGNSLLLG